MRRYISLLALVVRGTIYKVTCLLLGLAAVQTALFYRLYRLSPEGQPAALEDIISRSGVPLAAGAAFLLLCALLCLSGCEFSGSKLSYTLRRLAVREEITALIWACYYTLCFFLFWVAQAMTALWLCRLYTLLADPVYWSQQTAFLAFYRDDFLHGLLPLEETSVYVRNLCLAAGPGLSAACFSLKQRRGQKSWAFLVLAAMTAVLFPREIGSFGMDLLTIFLALAAAGYAGYGILSRDWEVTAR